MKNKMLTVFILLTALTSFGQIDMSDSTVQVVSYWEQGDKQNYSVYTEKIKLNGTDTTSKEYTSYDVEVTVLEADDKSYTIEWLYKNRTTNSKQSKFPIIMNIFKDMKVIYKTDEMGIFVEVVNWKELINNIHKAIAPLKTELKDDPDLAIVLKQIEATYSTKEYIESVSIKDIQQFHTFHGAKYKLGEVLEGEMKVPNVISTEPFDAAITIILDDINEEDSDFNLQATQTINKDQLTNATYNYLVTMAKNINADLPKREDLKDLVNETLTTSRIHETGWVVYSKQTTTVISDKTRNIDKKIIELK